MLSHISVFLTSFFIRIFFTSSFLKYLIKTPFISSSTMLFPPFRLPPVYLSSTSAQRSLHFHRSPSEASFSFTWNLFCSSPNTCFSNPPFLVKILPLQSINTFYLLTFFPYLFPLVNMFHFFSYPSLHFHFYIPSPPPSGPAVFLKLSPQLWVPRQ